MPPRGREYPQSGVGARVDVAVAPWTALDGGHKVFEAALVNSPPSGHHKKRPFERRFCASQYPWPS